MNGISTLKLIFVILHTLRKVILKINIMKKRGSNLKLFWFPVLFFTFLILSSQLVFSQSRNVGGLLTISEINSPGVGGISISIKGTSTETVSDNDGEYRIDVLGDESVLVFSYPGMITQEIVVGDRSRINIDLIKLAPEKPETVYVTQVNIILNESAVKLEKNVAKVLQDRLKSNSGITVTISKEQDLKASLNIYLGLANNSDRLEELFNRFNMRMAGYNKPAAEGYAVKLVNLDNAPVILAVGADNRGVLYAAGEILRQMEVYNLAIRFKTFDISSAPAYRFRGANNPQGGTMRKFTKSRAWTTDEWKDVILDYALAGANCFYAEQWGSGGERNDFLKSFDLMTTVGIRPNQYHGEFPEEWKSSGLSDWEWINSNWICPNIPEAREAILQQWTEKLNKLGDHDILRFYAGDPGGCRDERCMPWGLTFALLCEDITKIALKTHPDLIVLIANQDLTNEGDYAIFDYLSEKPQNWLYGIAYGPGSNAMSWYFRHKLNEDMFEYPGYGWLNRYLAETLNALPKDQKIVHYSDITHWTMAQYNVESPERNIAKSYGRRTWHTRPLALYKIFQAIMPFSQGDIIYTEGYHDHFNQYFWHRLLWNPHLEAKEVVQEYCRIYFGDNSSDLMTEAIFQLEKNLEIPLATNDGIDRYYVLVKEAGRLMPENIMKNNHLWRLFMQKAALDKYVQLKLQRELFQEERVRQYLEQGIESWELNTSIDKSITVLDEPKETPVMAFYREEADNLGIESEQLFGIRNVGYFRLEQDLRDLKGLSALLNKGKSTRSKKEKKKIMTSVILDTQKKTDYGRVHW